VTPYAGAVAQAPVTVSGSPPATSATIGGLTNGSAYTFTVTATNGIGTGPVSTASNTVTPAAPTAPGAPTGVSATGRNASATVSWSAPGNGGSAITSYTVTPSIAGVPQPPTLVTGSPPAISTTVVGLANGTAYTFTVTATNGIGTGPASAASNAVTPTAVSPSAFVQQTSSRSPATAALTVTPTLNVTTGNRLIVVTGTWNYAHATVSGVTDSAGDPFTELTHFTASDGTEQTVWSAPITLGGGTRPVVTVRTTSSADVGAVVLEYSGLSQVADATVLDRSKTATGSTTAAATVSSGATTATSAANGLALGFYVDSGFNSALSAGSGWTQRANVSPFGDMQLLVEDQSAALGATPSASFGAGPNAVWLASTLVFKAP